MSRVGKRYMAELTGSMVGYAAGAPRLPAIWVFPLLVWLWGIGTVLATRRYR